ncbi:MAG: cbb3-type cytochrome c oxidase subunit I [Burkholderiaceae bacterium]
MSAVLDQHGHGHDHAHDHPTGWRRWVYATNHKDIGTMYLLFSLTMFFVGGINALLLRAELFQPGLIVSPEFFNQLTTMHGLVMVFRGDHAGLGRVRQLDDPAADRCVGHGLRADEQLQLLAAPPAALLLVVSYFIPGGAPAAGWTVYVPLATQMGRAWTWASSRCTSWVPARSWARSTSSRPS